MSEDETFIRAVVDSPGDDTSRLVYADWLDDRDDPRGPYLRAEHEWAKPWRGGERPADSPRLRELAAGLDPVWVARVSRPPLGVCCEHLRFKERGPLVSWAEVDTFERTKHLRLPSDYRAFLLNQNGGFTPVAWFPTPGNDAGIELSSLYALESPTVSPPKGPGSLIGPEGFGDDARPLLPIGDCGSLDWLVVMDVFQPARCEVLLFEDFSDSGLISLADSFAQFLSIIEPHEYEES